MIHVMVTAAFHALCCFWMMTICSFLRLLLLCLSIVDDTYDGDGCYFLRPLLVAFPRHHAGRGPEPGDLQPELHARPLGALPLAGHEQQLLQPYHLLLDEPQV